MYKVFVIYCGPLNIQISAYTRDFVRLFVLSKKDRVAMFFGLTVYSRIKII